MGITQLTNMNMKISSIMDRFIEINRFESPWNCNCRIQLIYVVTHTFDFLSLPLSHTVCVFQFHATYSAQTLIIFVDSTKLNPVENYTFITIVWNFIVFSLKTKRERRKKMKRRQIVWGGVLFIFCVNMTVGQIIKSTNSTDKSANDILYPSSSVDLIVNFFKTYKHIKRLTLFLCNDDSLTRLSVSIPIHTDYDPTTSTTASTMTTTDAKLERQIQNDKPKLKQKHQRHGNGCLNFQQIVKYLMASGNFLIKGDGNIDATMFTTSGDDCNIDTKYEKLDSIYAYRLSEMLERGDFKQGVVLDLRCRQSQFILQQVNNWSESPQLINYFTHTHSHNFQNNPVLHNWHSDRTEIWFA